MTPPRDAAPAPGLADRAAANVAVAAVLAGLYGPLGAASLGLLGSDLRAPLALAAYALALLLPVALLHALVKAAVARLAGARRGTDVPDAPAGAEVTAGAEVPDVPDVPAGADVAAGAIADDLAPAAEAARATAGAGVLAAGAFCLGWRALWAAGRPGTDVAREVAVAVAASAALALLLVAMRAAAGRARSRRAVLLGGLAAGAGLALAGAAAGGLVRAGGTPAWRTPDEAGLEAAAVPPAADLAATAPSGLRVLVFGIDGADLDEVLPLCRAGHLPALGRLIDEGAAVRLRAHDPWSGSPVLATSLATGVPPETHGIDSMFVAGLPGLPPLWAQRVAPGALAGPALLAGAGLVVAGLGDLGPPPAHLRRAPALWQTVSRLGGSVRVVGWVASWPADAVRGELLTHSARRSTYDVLRPYRPERPGQCYPPDLWARLAREVGDPSDVPWHALGQLAAWSEGERGELAERRTSVLEDQPLRWLSLAVTGDQWSARALHHLLERDGPRDLTLFWCDACDIASHLWWDAAHPGDYPDTAPSRRERLGGVVPGAYRLADALLGEVLRRVDDRTVVLVVSDHGMSPVRFLSFTAYHADDALLIAWRPGVVRRAGVTTLAPEATLLDVAPTALHVLGYPAGAGPGRVLSELLAR